MKTGENRQHDLSSRDTISRVIVSSKEFDANPRL